MTLDETVTELVANIADQRMVNVLFLCDDNSCHSQIAEALLNFVGKGNFWAFSAGFVPIQEVDPIAIEVMRETGIPCGGLRPKGWHGFTTPTAPHIDIVICLGTHLPLHAAATLLPGKPITIIWQMEYSANGHKSQADRRSAHGRALRYLEERVLKLINKDIASRLTEAA